MSLLLLEHKYIIAAFGKFNKIGVEQRVQKSVALTGHTLNVTECISLKCVTENSNAESLKATLEAITSIQLLSRINLSKRQYDEANICYSMCSHKVHFTRVVLRADLIFFSKTIFLLIIRSRACFCVLHMRYSTILAW